MNPLRRSSKQAGSTNIHRSGTCMQKNTKCETTTAPKTWEKHRDNLTPLDGARQRIRAKTSQLTCEQGSPYDPAGVRHVPSHSDIAPRASWIVACQACRLSGFSGATQTPTSAVSRVHTVIETAKRPRELHSGIAMWICGDQAVAYSRTRTGALTFHETMSANLRNAQSHANYTIAKAFRPRILKKSASAA